jgi:glycosyltransferase involved in cell wall biosynthesis
MLYPKGISVVICCYNSAKKLPDTLKYLSEQVVNQIAWEVIIIDNASTDETAEIAIQTWSQFNKNISFRVITENTPGLSAARYCGIKNAKYEYIIFCDDDNWLSPDYLSIVYQNFQLLPNVGTMGGRSEAVFEIDPPKWLIPYLSAYAVGKQARSSGIINYRRFVWGAGMAVKNSLISAIYQQGFQSILTDRKGKALNSGGDGEICEVIMQAGYHLYYDENLFFQHFITKDRVSWSYLCRLYRGFGKSHWPLSLYKYVERRSKRKSFLSDTLYIYNEIIILLKELNQFSWRDWYIFTFKPDIVYEKRIMIELKIGKLLSILSSLVVYYKQIRAIALFSEKIKNIKLIK